MNKTYLTKLLFLVSLYICATLMSSSATAHCKWKHPHHCLADVGDVVVDFGKVIYGGTKKRAKMVWDDPVGSAINPWKVIDDSIPTPMSYVEYLVKNPEEIVETLKDPISGVVGMPVAMAISDGRNAALKKGVFRIPEEIKARLSIYYDESLLNSVRYTVGNSIFDGVTQGIALSTTADAITLVNVIVFKNEGGSQDPALWAHEVFHVRQYRNMGLSKFAAILTLEGYKNKHSAIEKPAYQFHELFSQIDLRRHITSRLLIGLGGKCIESVSAQPRSLVILSTCDPTEQLQQWIIDQNSEIRLLNTSLCLDVQWGKTENKTPLHVWPCNGGLEAQSFQLTSIGEIRNALKENLCVEAAGGETEDGTPIQVFECNHSTSQLWGKPNVKQLSSHDNRCVRANAGSKGSLVRLAPCKQSDLLQMWAMDENKGEIRLIGSPNMCLDVQWSKTEDGTPLHIWPCNGGVGAQLFTLTEHMQIEALGKCADIGDDSIQINSCRDSRLTQFWNTNLAEPDFMPNPRTHHDRLEVKRVKRATSRVKD